MKSARLVTKPYLNEIKFVKLKTKTPSYKTKLKSCLNTTKNKSASSSQAPK